MNLLLVYSIVTSLDEKENIVMGCILFSYDGLMHLYNFFMEGSLCGSIGRSIDSVDCGRFREEDHGSIPCLEYSNTLGSILDL